MNSTISNIVVGSARADKIQVKLSNSQKLPTSSLQPLRFTKKAEQELFQIPIIGFINKKDIGSMRIVAEAETLLLVEKTKLFYNEHLLAYLNNISSVELSEFSLSFIFLQYQPVIKIVAHLNMMLLLSQLVKTGSQSGKLDYEMLEKEFVKLLGNQPLSRYIPQARKHSYLKILRDC